MKELVWSIIWGWLYISYNRTSVKIKRLVVEWIRLSIKY